MRLMFKTKKDSLSLSQNRALSQMPNVMKFLKELLTNKQKLDEASHVELNTEMSLKEVHEPFSSNSREPIHEDRRLEIKELDEWRTVLFDATDPHIVATTPNEEIPLTVLSIFPFSTVEVTHPKFGTFKTWEKRTTPDTAVRTQRPKEHGRVLNVRRAQIQYSRITQAEIREHGRVTWPCTPKSINTLHYSLSSPLKNPNPSRCNSTRPPRHARALPPTPFLTLNPPFLALRMSSSHGKKVVVPASKKRNRASTSSGPTVEVRHPFLRFPIGPQEELFQTLRAQPLIAGDCIDWAVVEQVQLAEVIRALLTTDPWELFFGIIEPTYLAITIELCSMFYFQTVMTNYNDPSTVQFCLGGLVRQLSVPEFGTMLGLYTEEFKEENDLHALNCHIYRSPSRCWDALVPGGATYNPSRSKASTLPPSLSMRMIEKLQGTYPPRYRIAQSTKEEAYEDIPDDVPPQHEDPPTQPPPPSRPVHAAASYADISERLSRFE
ncbi:hypothetical protein GOBAR_AA34747 [Gossypium barbadense]|uniref:Uncharacterized protein n=1 Tax=Gossypium barbadense TaxID=3634 RepID=A0A2P5W4C0_GOSBA|nr:hypothetical protein GOBAR_AA34747 [Gossypium barbadense]